MTATQTVPTTALASESHGGETPEQRAEWFAQARALLNYLESTPELPLPFLIDAGLHCNARAALDEAASVLGAEVRDSSEGYVAAVRDFSPHRLRYQALGAA